MCTLFLVAKNTPSKRNVVGTFYHIGIAVLSIPEFAMVNPNIFGTVIFNGKVVPSLVGIAARPLNHNVADDDIRRLADMDWCFEHSSRL